MKGFCILIHSMIHKSLKIFAKTTILHTENKITWVSFHLQSHPAVIEAGKKALDQHGAGLSSVRFICGTQVSSPCDLKRTGVTEL